MTIGTIALKAPMLTEQHVEKWKKSMKNDFDGMKNEIKEDLKKLAEEDFRGMKNEIGASFKKMVDENLEKMKNDFEEMKKEIREDMKRSNEEVLKRVNERDQHLKAIERLKSIKSTLPKKPLNEEC